MSSRPILALLLMALVCWDSGSTAEILQPELIDGIRLQESPSTAMGMLQVRAGGRWGTVCEDGFDDRMASVVCRQIGQESTTAYAIHRRVFGRGSDDMPVWVNSMICTGNETSISDCPATPTHPSFCSHLEDVGVVCHPKVQVDEVRLVGGATPLEGRLEVSVLGHWGTVCDDWFGHNSVQAVCRQLTGQRTRIFPNAELVASYIFGRADQQVMIWMDDVRCDVDDANLNECSHTRFADHNCGHAEDVCVRCE